MKPIWPIPKIEFVPFVELVDTRPIAVITSRAAWSAVEARLHGLNVICVMVPIEATEAHWDAMAAQLQGHSVYAVGGGLATDCAKYLAVKQGIPLAACLPTALSVDAFLTRASGVRRSKCVAYVETVPPERVVIDFDVLSTAPAHLRAAGICDVLSIATGLWDWRFAEEQGQNSPETPFIPWVADAAQAILKGALDCAEAAGRGDHAGLKQLLDCLAMEVQLCNLIGHARPEEGSEHYFAYSVENVMIPGLPHAELVAPGILTVAALQGQDTVPLRQAFTAAGVRADNLPPDVVEDTVRGLKEYVHHHRLPFGIAHTITEGDLRRLSTLK